MGRRHIKIPISGPTNLGLTHGWQLRSVNIIAKSKGVENCRSSPAAYCEKAHGSKIGLFSSNDDDSRCISLKVTLRQIFSENGVWMWWNKPPSYSAMALKPNDINLKRGIRCCMMTNHRLSKYLKETAEFEETGANGLIYFYSRFRLRENVLVRPRFIWFRIETSAGLLWTR
jgi:hypothetical protein